jgi:hypothetical protein
VESIEDYISKAKQLGARVVKNIRRLRPAIISYGTGPCDIYIPPDENGQCPEGHRFVNENTGCVPPNCQPLNCDVENPPPECGERPVVCPDGSTVSPGNDCPEPPPENGVEPPEGDSVDSQHYFCEDFILVGVSLFIMSNLQPFATI